MGKDKFIFYLGDNMVVGGVKRFVDEFERSRCNCFLTLAEVKDPERFGVPEIEDGRIISVEEKPKKPKSNFAVSGIYLYDSSIFEAVKAIKPSARGELEISDAHQYLIDKGYKVGYAEITGWWKDTGKPSDLLEANRLVLDNITPSIQGEVDGQSTVAGKVIIEKGARIVNSVVRGPVIIGERCVIEDSYIGPFTAIGNNTVIRKSEVEYSIILRDCKVLSVGIRLEGSILGNDVEVVEGSGKPRVHRFMIGDQSRVEVV
jgi:glucose-1-phosphate thymidylyltransferase